MGNCKCLIYIHDKGELHPDDFRLSQTPNSNLIISSDPLLDLSKFKSNFERSKLSQIGSYITKEEFYSHIKDEIKDFIENNKLTIPKEYEITNKKYHLEPILFKNGNIYFGEWNENFELEGYGKYYLTDQDILIEGIWKKGNNIYARIFYKDGERYTGEISDSEYHGEGEYISSNGEIYKGDFINGKKNGYGKFYFRDGVTYNGGVNDGLFAGKGEIKWADGTKYNGYFNNSVLSGFGYLINVNGDKYEGYFDNNFFNGDGVYLYKNGEKYEGKFLYGVMTGKGKFYRLDGIIFDGNFNDDLPNGNGNILYQNNVLNVKYRNGKITENPIIIRGNMDDFKGIDLSIIPMRPLMSKKKLSHLIYQDISQYQMGNSMSFLQFSNTS